MFDAGVVVFGAVTLTLIGPLRDAFESFPLVLFVGVPRLIFQPSLEAYLWVSGRLTVDEAIRMLRHYDVDYVLVSADSALNGPLKRLSGFAIVTSREKGTPCTRWIGKIPAVR